MDRRLRTPICFLILAAVATPAMGQPPTDGSGANDSSPAVLATVNGQPITEDDLEFLMLSRGIPAVERDKARGPLLEMLIDRRLVRQFLQQRKIRVPDDLIDEQVARIRRLIEKNGDDPDAVLNRIGFNGQRLRDEVGLPLAWQRFLRQVVTDEAVRNYYREHREELDGTRRRARQIFLTVQAAQGAQAALDQLAGIRADVTAGKLTFEEAARKFSQAPTASRGGDVGRFPFRGKMPISFTEVAFRHAAGEISQPFQSPFGAHLIQVTEVLPGQLSLEDVRPLVISALSNQRWREVIADAKKSAEISREEPAASQAP